MIDAATATFCPRCGVTKPATVEHFYRNRSRPCGLSAWCKPCTTAANVAWNSRNKDKVRAADARSSTKNREHRILVHRQWYAQNAERERANCARYRAEHPEYFVAWRAEHPDCGAEYRARNGDRVRELGRARQARRHARIIGAEGSHTAADIAQQYLRQHGRCYWCDEKVGKKYHVDHVTPLVKKGSNGPENLVIACPRCNQCKGAKLPHEFSGRLC